MIRVLEISGGVGILGVNILFLVLLLIQLPPASSIPNGLSDEDSKSLWHIMAQSLLAVKEVDRERFMDLCLKRRIHCDTSRFREPDPDFSWREGITKPIKTRFWYAYACVYNANLTQCPVDGEWSPWSPWSDCSASCDATGNQTRTRTCTNPMPVQGGELCHGSTKRARPCLGMCKNGTDRGGVEGAKDFLEQVHMAYPSLQHDCFNAHCTYGVVQRTITEKFVMAKYWSSLSCVKYGGACPVDGKWGGWGAWTQCSLKCGAGSRTRTRLCNSPQPAFAGHPCKGEFHEQQSCVMRDCGSTSSETFTEWTKWTPCSVSCGVYGAQQSTRVCLRHVGCDLVGVMTPYLNRSRPCYTGDCPTLGGWSEWSDWTDCSAACGVGRQSRIRMCDSPYPSGGLFCLGEVVDFQLCKGLSCVGQPVHPENTAYRRRPGEVREDVLVSRGDKYLDGPLNPTMEGLYSPWSQWVRCSATCGKGTRIRKRWCSAQTTPMPPCEGEVRQIQFCNVFVCPVVGGWGVWLPWTPCSKTCGHGERQRYRTCNNPLPQFGGSCLGDSMRVEKCDAGTCPRIARGTWSDWSPWSQCTATCDGGQRQRKRVRQGYMNSSRTAESVSDEGDGVQETLICNTQPCPVDGSWAEWGDWSRCSVHCGLGRRVRDRTCTDPSPVFGGTVCPGPGSDLVHCFAGPCKDTEDRAVYLGTTTWIRFAPHNRPTRFLVIYLHFKPMAPDGSLLHRYRQCRSVFDDDDNDKEGGSKGVTLDDAEDRKNSAEDKKADDDEKCQLLVHVSLDQAAVVLLVMARGARLEIQSPVTLSLGAWHEILVEVLRSGASLRVNNHERLFANFSRPLIKDLDFDSYMILGASDNKTVGMTGSISSLSINFRTQDLFSSTDWEGQGTPIGRHAVSVQSINPSVQLPHFHGVYYSPVRLYHTDRLAVRMTLALDGGEGLLLYCPGQGLGTLVTLGLRQRRFVLCMRCSRGAVTACHHGDPVNLHQWYHVSVLVEDTESEMRVDQGKALQLTCKGLPFRPRKMIFVGGRSAIMWEEVRRSANYTKGFFGVLGTLVVNGRTLAFRHAVLLSRDGRINMDGYSRATRITPVFEHKSSVVVLHCEVEQPIDPAIDVRVVWLLRDTIIEPSALVDIVKPVGLTKRVGSLQLKPGAHSEGIYACLISRDGALELSHVFPVFRHAARPELYEGQVEWVFLKVLLILLPILTIACIAYRLRNWFLQLYRKWFGKPEEPEKEPLLPPLPTETMEVWKPDQVHLHGKDEQGGWDSYLVQGSGQAEKVDVVSFGSAQPRKLSATPGISSDRPIHITQHGQIQLADNPVVASNIHFEHQLTDELASEEGLMDYGGPMYATESKGFNMVEEGMDGGGGPLPEQLAEVQGNPVYANLTHNRPYLVACRQQQPLRPLCQQQQRSHGEGARVTSSPVSALRRKKTGDGGAQEKRGHSTSRDRSAHQERRRSGSCTTPVLKAPRKYHHSGGHHHHLPRVADVTSSPPQGSRQHVKTVRMRSRSYSGERGVSAAGAGGAGQGADRRSRGLYTSTNRERTWWIKRSPCRGNTHVGTGRDRSNSHERSHHVVSQPSDDPLRQENSPSQFDLHYYQQLKVKVPSPVVFERGKVADFGSSPKHHVFQLRRNSEDDDDDDDVDDRRRCRNDNKREGKRRERYH